MRVGLIAPCIGVGGGDALMLGLVNHCHNVEFTGIYTRNLIEYKNYSWAKKACKLPPIHNKLTNTEQQIDGINYHEHESNGIRAAIKDAEVVMTWCLHSMDRNVPVTVDVPVIEYIQNSDKYAADVVKSNIGIPHYYSACSETAAQVAPKDCRVRIIYNGIDANRTVPRLGRDMQRSLWKLGDRKILLFMGRFVKEKHPEMAITCLQHLPEEWVTVFVGNGYQNKEIHNLAQMIAPDRVFFVESKYHVGDALAAADTFILPSDFEGHSLALNEAWLAGVPTVYTDFETMYELERKFGSLGVMIPKVSSPETVADAIVKASSGSSETLAYVANARNVVWNNFTLPRVSFQWEQYFEEVIHAWRHKKLYGSIRTVSHRQEYSEV